MSWDKIQLYNIPKPKKKSRAKIAKKIVEGYKQENRKNPTIAEKKFENTLKELGIKYEPQKIIQARSKFRIADFYLPEYHTIIEIDGAYYNDPVQQRLDKDRSAALLGRKKVLRIIRITNNQVMKYTLSRMAAMLTMCICPFIEPHWPPEWD